MGDRAGHDRGLRRSLSATATAPAAAAGPAQGGEARTGLTGAGSLSRQAAARTTEPRQFFRGKLEPEIEAAAAEVGNEAIR